MALSAELGRRLSSSDFGPPEKRLRLAVQVFDSPHLRVARKEETVLETLCKQESWDALLECLQSERFSKAVLRPTVRKKLVQAAAKDAECGRLLLMDTPTANYLAARPQEFKNLCGSLFAKPDLATLKAAVACARRSPTPMSLAPFITSLSKADLEDEAARLLATVVSDGQEVLDNLGKNISPKAAGLAARVIAAKYGRSNKQTEEFIIELIGKLNDNEAIGQALSALESVENRDWLIGLFDKILAAKKPKNILAAFRPLAHLDLLLFESLLPKLMGAAGKDDDIDGLLLESLEPAEKEQRAHKLIPKLLEGVTADLVPKFNKFPKALSASALKWPSKHLTAAITGLIFFLENHNEGIFFTTAAPLLSCLLDASKAAQHNIPDLVRDKVTNLLQQVAKILENLAPMALKAATKTKDSKFLTAYLELCLSYGELHLLMKHYAENTDSVASTGQKLMDFSLLLPFVPKWDTLAESAFADEACRPSVVLLVDQKIRAATLLGLELSPEQQEKAALMLASCRQTRLYSSLELVRQSLNKDTLSQVADSLAAALLENKTRTFSHAFDNSVALALLRTMKAQNVASGVLGSLELKSATLPVDPLTSPDKSPPENLQSFLAAFGILKPTDKITRCLSAAALLSACHGLNEDWDKAAPVLISILAGSKHNFDFGKIITWLCGLNANFDESLRLRFVAALFGNNIPNQKDIQGLTSFFLKPMSTAMVKYLLANNKVPQETREFLEKIASSNKLQITTNKPSKETAISDIRSASAQQLTELLKSKAHVDAFVADAVLGRMLIFDLKDPATLKAVAICLNTFLTSRAALAVDRLPVIQQRLHMICAATIELEDEEMASDVAHLVEGMGVAMAKHKKDMSRVAPYFVADVLGLFETRTLKPAVKVHMERYLQSLLKLCDEFGELFLLRATTPACQQILHAQIAEKKKSEHYV